MDRILVLDFGGQYCHLIARRIRALGVRADIEPFNTKAAGIAHDESIKGIVLSGGPGSVYEEGSNLPDPAIFTLKTPILGICWGHQLLGKFYHAEVKAGKTKEYGKQSINLDTHCALFAGLSEKETVWMSHGDNVTHPPAGFHKTATSADGHLAAMMDDAGTRFGVQFHPEVVHTPNGNTILDNFLKITKATRDWNPTGQVERLVKEIQTEVGPTDHVLMAVSGGVDSTVAALLVRKAIGKRLHAVFIDHGLLRQEEGGQVKAAYDKMGLTENVRYADESKRFFAALKGESDPEKKRVAIGHAFIHAFEAHAKAINATLKVEKKGELKWLAQGTIYPDRIESANASKTANKIKTHHNLALPKDMTLKVIEPLKDFYKDEVRAVGKELGVPKEILSRHPFPGPGLAVRCLGEVTEEKIELVRRADAIFMDALRAHGYYDKVWQAFAALLNVRSVGVQGDERTYGHMIALRAVTAIDGMTADWAKLPPELLEEVSVRITNNVRGVNRVVYDITQKPPATIEME